MNNDDNAGAMIKKISMSRTDKPILFFFLGQFHLFFFLLFFTAKKKKKKKARVPTNGNLPLSFLSHVLTCFWNVSFETLCM